MKAIMLSPAIEMPTPIIASRRQSPRTVWMIWPIGWGTPRSIMPKKAVMQASDALANSHKGSSPSAGSTPE
jgi:hypothetical protein